MTNANHAARAKTKMRKQDRMQLSRPISQEKPVLRFTPYAWAKLVYLRDLGPTEVGGFGISAADDLFLIEDVQLVRQICTVVTVKFDDASVADFFDEQVDQGRSLEQCGRLWLHTHPGDSAQPSSTDEQTFARCFGRTDWSVMFIVAEGGQQYARLRFNVGPGGSMEVAVAVDYRVPFAGSAPEEWSQEYEDNVSEASPSRSPAFNPIKGNWGDDDEFFDAWNEYIDDGGLLVGEGGCNESD